MILNATHDPRRRAIVAAANVAATDFPIQNLPFGVFDDDKGARGGVAIGDRIVDLAAAQADGLFEGEAARAAQAASGPTLNALLALGNPPASALRARLSELLDESGDGVIARYLVPMTSATLSLPVAPPGFTDMSVSPWHAGRSTGQDERGNPKLPPQFKWMPVGYNGRTSSVVVSGTDIVRPNGQWLATDDSPEPSWGPEPRQDYEMEMGVWIGGGNALGTAVAIDAARDLIFGFCLLNDWSARRIQRWESRLGPFLGKAQGTTVSPWIVTAEALEPFRIPATPRFDGDPAVLPHLWSEADQADGGYDIGLHASLRTAALDAPVTICDSNYRYMYWTWAQIVAHHASGGCNLAPGSLIGSGTASGPDLSEAACLSEKSRGGREPWLLPDGTRRTYIENGDEIMVRGRAVRDGYVSIGFGACDGRLIAAE